MAKPMSKLGKFNKYFFQIFFTRLTKHIEEVVEDYKLLGYDSCSIYRMGRRL